MRFLLIVLLLFSSCRSTKWQETAKADSTTVRASAVQEDWSSERMTEWIYPTSRTDTVQLTDTVRLHTINNVPVIVREYVREKASKLSAEVEAKSTELLQQETKATANNWMIYLLLGISLTLLVLVILLVLVLVWKR